MIDTKQVAAPSMIASDKVVILGEVRVRSWLCATRQVN